ncbi:protein BUD31 homolog isoform X9 [Dermacentor andersoni]|uniref:protein BUD31 homolog isoform X9 n=1 Tax=Dermacentor andersoni TaxID=34620 RepID=UPI003B3ACFCA
MSLAESIARLMVCHTPSEAIGQVEVGTQCSFPLADKSVGCCFRAGSESRSVQTTEAVDQSSYPSEAQRMFIAMIKGSSLPATLVVIDALATRESIDENPDGLTAAFVRCSAAALGTCCSSLNHLGSQGETESHEGKRKVESLWPIFKIHHQKSRYVFDLFHKRKAISKELYEYCIREGLADRNLMAKWKKQGYENLCCLRCIQTRDTNFGTNCICRVPKAKLEEGKIVECVHCGCRGCSG